MSVVEGRKNEDWILGDNYHLGAKGRNPAIQRNQKYTEQQKNPENLTAEKPKEESLPGEDKGGW